MTIRFDRETTGDFERASTLEWLETNGLGGWAGSTVSGANTRRYHGLLVSATRPPVGRTVMLSRLDETIRCGDGTAELGCNRYPGAIHPRGFEHLVSFERDLFPVFEYEAAGVRLTKTIAAIDGENTTVVLYEVASAPGPFTLELRPFVAARDYHSLVTANDAVGGGTSFTGGLLRVRSYQGIPEMTIHVPGAAFAHAPDWYRRFEYPVEQYRGLDFQEDLWTPGWFHTTLRTGDRLAVVVSTDRTEPCDGAGLIAGERRRRLKVLREAATSGSEPSRRGRDSATTGREAAPGNDTASGAATNDGEALVTALTLAADQFLVRRGDGLRTIIAGYHWFGDWGRDTMIALPGICLATGRHDEARKILEAFAVSVSRGMLPNRFPDGGEEPEYNTVDATLWFFVAVHEYLAATGDEDFVAGKLLDCLRDIVSWHDAGTRYGIRVDADGLLLAGEPGVQLTWMDAKVGDWVVTPRHGKPVEVNALWHNALSILADLEAKLGDPKRADELAGRARRVAKRFVELFWNEQAGCLYDVVSETGPDASIRPNQVIALSLPYPLLAKGRALSVLRVVDEKLLTPVGLRSLSPDHPDYRPVYGGDPRSRDGAYHQGTVWAWLLGPWAAAVARYRGEPGRRRARALLRGLGRHLAEAGLGTISEIFDAEAPHTPRGCIAQAWSVGEVLRAWKLLDAEEPAETAEPAGTRSTGTARGKA